MIQTARLLLFVGVEGAGPSGFNEGGTLTGVIVRLN